MSKRTNQNITSRSGSHAGRGFRYQDAVSAWLAIRCWGGELNFGGVVPEGMDDAELTGADGLSFVQVKSRRGHLGAAQKSDVAKYIRQLWRRADAAVSKPKQLLLVLERGVRNEEVAQEVMHALSRFESIKSLVKGHRLAKHWLSMTDIMVSSSPMENSIDLLVEKLDCAPIAASIYFAAIADCIGDLSDRNGTRGPNNFLSLSVSDLEREINRLAGAISTDDLQAAIIRGYCEPVDFLSPLNDPHFYLGTDVQPGHVAAGLLAERPEACECVLQALEHRRVALIAGPSGSGKSGLMWQSAHQSRHTIRWFRIRGSATESDVPDILRIADTFRATAHMPIGLILDDIGRGRTNLWDILAAEVSTRENVLILGSLREEDMLLVAKRSSAVEIREKPDATLAERIWKELVVRKQTEWKGWKEPWQKSDGLLLEYTHLLSQGERLSSVLRDQVERRVREKRHTELDVLRLTSIAGSTGATLGLQQLREFLSVTENDLSEVLKRLIEEHLIYHIPGKERVGSLHQIRASMLATIAHETPPPSLADTVKRVVGLIDTTEIEGFIARTITRDPRLAEVVIEGATERLNADGSLKEIAAILRGLDVGSIGVSVKQWLSDIRRLNIPKTQLTMVVLFSVAGTEEFLPEKLGKHFEAARQLAKASYQDHRISLIDRVADCLTRLFNEEPDEEDLKEFLAACHGSTLAAGLISDLEKLDINLLDLPLDSSVELLETAGAIAPQLAQKWVAVAGQNKLFELLLSETPWISNIELRNETEGLAVCADVFHISERLQPDIHENVVDLCRKMLAIAPHAKFAVSTAVAADGNPLGMGDVPVAQKHIPRENLPADVGPTRNKRWIAAVAQIIAPVGISQYLGEGKQLLDQLILPLERLIDGIIRGKPREKQLNELGIVHEKSNQLVRPPATDVLEGNASAIGVSDLQSVINHCSADLLRDLLELPEHATAVYSNTTKVMERLNHAINDEPWDLIGDNPPASLLRLNEILEEIRLITGAAGHKGKKANLLFPKLAKSASRNNALRLISSKISQEIERSIHQLNAGLQATVQGAGYKAYILCKPKHEVTGPWPYLEANVVVILDSMGDWYDALATLSDPLLKVCGKGRQLTILPAVLDFYFPEETMSGIETLWPIPITDCAWLENIGLQSIKFSSVGALDKLTVALLETSTIAAFGCATEFRPSEERKMLQQIEKEIDDLLDEIISHLDPSDHDVVQDLVKQLRAAGPDFSISFWQQMHGGDISSSLIQLNALKFSILDIELNSYNVAE